MKALDNGHVYKLDSYDGDQYARILVFMKREGDKYPGNKGHYPGTNCQEVLRALIDRVKYLHAQIPCEENEQILLHLRGALFEFESRAAQRHGRTLMIPFAQPIELEPHCSKCGHIQCEHLCA